MEVVKFLIIIGLFLCFIAAIAFLSYRDKGQQHMEQQNCAMLCGDHQVLLCGKIDIEFKNKLAVICANNQLPTGTYSNVEK